MSNLVTLFSETKDTAMEQGHELGALRNCKDIIMAVCKKCDQSAFFNFKTKESYGGAVNVRCNGKHKRQEESMEEVNTSDPVSDKPDTEVSNQPEKEENEVATKKKTAKKAKKKAAKKSIAKKSTKKKATGAVAKVWEICEKHKKATRKEQLAACVKAGINPATAATQVSKFRHEKGLVRK